MANLLDTLNNDLANALRGRDEIKVSTLRFLLSKIKNAQIAKGQELNEEEILGEISKNAKQHNESINAYENAKRDDLVRKEKQELEILMSYLPEAMAEGEIIKIVDEVISQTGAKSAGDIGQVMGQVMAKVKGRADGAVVSKIVKSKLGLNG